MYERAKLQLILPSKSSREARQISHSLWNPHALLERRLGFNSREISWLREETPGDETKETVRAGGFSCLIFLITVAEAQQL